MSSPHQQAGGALGKCLGGTGHWTGTFVATPSLASPNLPPCLTKPDEAWRHLQSERVRALNQAPTCDVTAIKARYRV